MSENCHDAKDRVLLVIQTKGTNVNALSKLIGVPQSTVAGQLQSGKIQINVIEGILRVFPDVSPDWLILGDGNMYRTNADQLRTTDQYYALVDSIAELHRRHEAEVQAMILANQRAATVNISNIGNTTINNNGKDE